MKNRKWTDQEILLLKNKVKFDEQGMTKNSIELSVLLGREVGAIYRRVYRLRKEGALPGIYYDDPICPFRRNYTSREDRFIANAFKSGAPVREIAEVLDRSEGSVYARIVKLRDLQIIDYRRKNWSENECTLLIAHSKFDQHGYLTNVNELMRLTGRSRCAVFKKIELMRKTGEIQVLPDRSHTNQASTAISNYYYQLNVCTKKEPTPVPASEGLRK